MCIFKSMNKSNVSALSLLLLFFFTSCETTKAVPPAGKTSLKPPAPVLAPEPPKPTDDEYRRSINDIEDAALVSKEDFEADKKEILAIIDKLAVIMSDFDYDTWLTYIEPVSVQYWKNPRNLAKASLMLPVKGQKLNNLNDYFRFVFIPSRKNRKVDEIRYLSQTSVKAVQVSGDTDIVFYYFKKIDGKWFVSIPPLES